MGLSSFPTAAAEGMLPMLVLNTVLSLALIKDKVKALLKVIIGADYWAASDYDQDPDGFPQENPRERRVSVTQVKSLCHSGGGDSSGTCWVAISLDECCVCLCGFEAGEEVSELSCKHFFHRGCLDKWFDNKHSTCPLCRSIL